MKRRAFLKNSSIGVVGTSFMPQFLNSVDHLSLGKNDPILIVIQLSGGNDGLNTIIPYENDVYYNARPNLAIAKNEVLKISDELGLNASMGGLHKLYMDGHVSIINSVGYPNPNRSHFRSMDIWHTATSGNVKSQTGWLGRYMDSYCKHAHDAIEVDSQLSLALNGVEKNGIAMIRSNSMDSMLGPSFFNRLQEHTSDYDLDEDNMGYLFKTFIDTKQSSKYLKESHNIKNNNYTFPRGKLGQKLGQVSQYIRSGFATKVYYISHTGFDSHANQRNAQDRLLKEYSESVNALVESLKKSGHFDHTLIMTFSEFGRRVKENASKGTDHGKANNVFLIGKDLKRKGIYNDGPDLLNLDDGDVKYNIDFRNIYQDVIQDWFRQDASKVISKRFDPLGIIG